MKSTTADEFSRMNMPFELGIDFGTRLHGSSRARKKRFLILGATPHEFKIALSDLGGVDIKHHENDSLEVIRATRDWFFETVGVGDRFEAKLHSPTLVAHQYSDFIYELFDERIATGISEDEATEDLERMPMAEWIDAASGWVEDNVTRLASP